MKRAFAMAIAALLPTAAFAEKVRCIELLGDLHCSNGTKVSEGVLGVTIDDDGSYIGRKKKTHEGNGLYNFPEFPSSGHYGYSEPDKKTTKTFSLISGAGLILIGMLIPTERDKSLSDCKGSYSECDLSGKKTDSGMVFLKTVSIVGGAGLIAFSFTIDIDSEE